MKYTTEIKKSPPHLLKKFAVCDIPLYDICDYNVSRDQCKELGCCFYKGVCYEKAVPIYVQVLSTLIVFLAGVFIVAFIYRVVQEAKREMELYMENTAKKPKKPVQRQLLLKPPSPFPSSNPSTPSSTDPTIILSTDPSVKKSENQVEDPVTPSKQEEKKEDTHGTTPQPAS